MVAGNTCRVFRVNLAWNARTAATTKATDIINLPSGSSVKALAIDRMNPFTVYAGTNRGVYRVVPPIAEPRGIGRRT